MITVEKYNFFEVNRNISPAFDRQNVSNVYMCYVNQYSDTCLVTATAADPLRTAKPENRRLYAPLAPLCKGSRQPSG